ncbi:ATP-binding protein [Brevibacillus agri]|nr:ATP-binding protein [Brevibacillus agri]MED4570694.1 ATP-binding protein [Brevibacillus agri]WHX30683.1 ATP-binding protein [Brevibacillus agri]
MPTATKLTSALIDRLIHHTHILSFTGESFRFKQAWIEFLCSYKQLASS